MPSVSDQFLSVFVAPLPFVLAMAAIAVAIWKAMEWRYRGIIELWQTMHTQVANEADIAKARSAELNDKVATLEKDVGALREKARSISALKAPLSRLQQTTEDAKMLSARSTDAAATLSTMLSNPPNYLYGGSTADLIRKTTTERSDG
jgi:hypothetical protein